MRAVQLVNERKQIGESDFLQMVVWQLAQPVPGCVHLFKYRLVYVVADTCVLRYDNETGKGDHKHIGEAELPYAFIDMPALIADFFADIGRWKDENGSV